MELNSQEIEVKDMEIARLFDRNELRRLEKASREKNKEKLIEWGKAFESRIIELYEKEYIKILQDSINNYMLIMIFSLHFNEKTRFGKKRIDDGKNLRFDVDLPHGLILDGGIEDRDHESRREQRPAEQ